MPKKNKLSNNWLIVIGVVVVLALGVGIVSAQSTSILDRLINVAGTIWGQGLLDKTHGDIDLSEISEEPQLGSSLRYTDESGLVSYTLSGAFDSSQRASTTLISVLNPFFESNATNTDWTNAGNVSYLKTNVWHGSSTVEYLVVDFDGTATSSQNIECGSSADPYSASTYDLINTLNWQNSQGSVDNYIPTSTSVYIDTRATSTGGVAVKSSNTGQVHTLQLDNQYPWITCVVSSTADDFATYGTNQLIGSTSLNDGRFYFRVSQGTH